MDRLCQSTAFFHLPGLFEFYELYRRFLPLFREHREYFFDWCEIGSVYGAPADCIWGGEGSASETLTPGRCWRWWRNTGFLPG